MQLLCGTMVQMAQDEKPAATAERASETELRLAYLSLLFLHLGTRLGLPRFELQLCAGKTFTAAVAAFYAECNVDLARGLGLAAAKRLGRAYNAEQHLGGVFYVFVRGVDSTGTYGVIGARPTAQLLTRLDSLFVPQQTSTTAALQLVPAPEGILQPINGTSGNGINGTSGTVEGTV